MSSTFMDSPIRGQVNGSSIVIDGREYGMTLLDGWKGTNIREGDTVSCSHFHIVDNVVNIDRSSFLSLDPDHVMDVTDVASTFNDSTDDAFSYVARLFLPKRTTHSMIRGMVLNHALDSMIRNPDQLDQTLVDEALTTRPLAIAAATVHDPHFISNLQSEVLPGLESIRNQLKNWNLTTTDIEQTCIDATWGLQGRFDVVLNDSDGSTIVEMKSGVGKPSHAHYGQLALYGLMGRGKRCMSIKDMYLWYPLAQNRIDRLSAEGTLQRKLLQHRNTILGTMRQLCTDPESILTHLKTINPGLYREEYYDLQSYIDQLLNCPSEIKSLILENISFIVREQSGTRHCVQPNTRVLSSLWRTSHDTKLQEGLVLTNMELESEASDFHRMHLVFNLKSTDSPQTSDNSSRIGQHNIRVGDLILLYPQSPTLPALYQTPDLLMKGSIMSIHPHRVEISLRNKHLRVDNLREHQFWCIEGDVSDSQSKSLYSSTARYTCSNDRRRNILAGLMKPTFSDRGIPSSSIPDDLTVEQQSIVHNALKSNDMFLIQGPPGTGKTSAVLRSIVHILAKDRGERILILAYTNRAADEICETLQHRCKDIEFMRHGSKDGSRFREHSIPHIASLMSPSELAHRIASCRCIVSTVTSMHTSPEIYDFGEFTTCILDEASQVLEPQILGVLSRVRRSILIGDQCQLPAVVSQQDIDQHNTSIDRISFTGMGRSLFERLIYHYERCGWNDCSAMLTHQGRMHADVMAFPSQEFYRGELKTISEWQRSTVVTTWNAVLESRTRFISITTRDIRENIDIKIAVELANDIYNAASEPPSIGIISPFRSKNNALIATLPDHLRDIVTVDTVERYQGSERDVIIYLTAVSSLSEFETIRNETTIRGAVVDRKLNVALTRARHQIVVIGVPEILRVSNSYSRLVEQYTTHASNLNANLDVS